MQALWAQQTPLYEMRDDVQSRWISFENPTGEKGAGGKANQGAKGAAFKKIPAGEELVLMDVAGAGVINRMWFTMSNRSPRMLRSIVLRMYWDDAETPAVETPFGDFFGAILGEMKPFESELFSSPEGRSFNAFVPMPFRTRARITFTNDSEEDLSALFYDINYSIYETGLGEPLYFHATWRRERWTELGKDFTILPKIMGKGRFLGAHVGVIGHPDNLGWWGEGEVKIFLDGDEAFPTLVGTGTEDYVGTAYFQGEFSNRHQGSLLIDNVNMFWSFYRHHVPDPVFFHQDIRVTIQQMGGAMQEFVKEMLEKEVEIIPVSVATQDAFVSLLDSAPPKKLDDDDVPYGWTNYYRRDDVSAVALFYLDKPENGLPRIAPREQRIAAVGERNCSEK
ncbi:MAG TPA: DUF2961 domain-containing protein [Candidatus Hydrogenedentes bacterium]|nr:DUF2961 domain-containing protein [Candidatus Hydrogenedentota bacterium]